MKARGLIEAMTKAQVLDLMPEPETTVWTALVSHGFHDFDLFASRSRRELKEQLETFAGEDAILFWNTALIDPHHLILGSQPFVWIAVIAHEHGYHVHAAAAEDDLYEDLIEYCTENWESLPAARNEAPPADPRHRVARYFRLHNLEALFIDRYDLP